MVHYVLQGRMKICSRKKPVTLGVRVKVITPPYNDGRWGIVDGICGDDVSVTYDKSMSPLLSGTWDVTDLEVIP